MNNFCICLSEEVSNKLKVFEDIKLLILKQSISNSNIVLENGGMLKLEYYKDIPVFKLVINILDKNSVNVLFSINTGKIYIEKDELKYLCESPNDILNYINI